MDMEVLRLEEFENHTDFLIDEITNQTNQGAVNLLDHFPRALATYHHVFILMTAYFSLVKLLGPKVMSTRKPFQLKFLIRIYNISQIVMNIYILSRYVELMGYQGLKFWSNVCQPVTSANPGNPEFEKKMMDAMYVYYVNKIIDLLDTVFFILRKKDSQVTFLHLFHHTTMVCSTWTSIVYVREEISVIFAGINAFIHIIMYTYYFLASFGPSMQKYLWWKKYITKLQIVQFVMALTCLAKMKMEGCHTNSIFWSMWCINISIFLALFTHFYIQSYLNKSKIKKEA